MTAEVHCFRSSGNSQRMGIYRLYQQPSQAPHHRRCDKEYYGFGSFIQRYFNFHKIKITACFSGTVLSLTNGIP